MLSMRSRRCRSPPSTEEISRSSTRCTVATMPKAKAPATSALIRAKAMMMRWARLCLNSIAALGEAIADAMDGMQQRFFERFVDHLAQLVHMAAQAVAVRAVVAPQGFFQHFTAQDVRAFLHQHRQQLEADRVELEQPALA